MNEHLAKAKFTFFEKNKKITITMDITSFNYSAPTPLNPFNRISFNGEGINHKFKYEKVKQ